MPQPDHADRRGVTAEWLLEFIEIFGGPGPASSFLRNLAALRRWPVSLDSFDDTGVGALRHHLARARLVAPAGPFERPDTTASVDATGCLAAADAVDLVAQAVTVANRRRVPEPSRLAVTATADIQITGITERLGVRRLWELVEQTIRSAEQRVTLGAPYWNHAALERLRPSLEGARSRDVTVDLIIQGGMRAPSVALDRVHAFAHELRTWNVPRPGFDTVTVWQFDADRLAVRHILLHAKFVVADATCGYLGSANMTDQGFEVNFEIGAMLGPRECEQLLAVLDVLREADVLQRA